MTKISIKQGFPSYDPPFLVCFSQFEDSKINYYFMLKLKYCSVYETWTGNCHDKQWMLVSIYCITKTDLVSYKMLFNLVFLCN